MDAADSCKHYHSDLDSTGGYQLYGRVSALGGLGLHTARNTKEKQGIRIDALLFWFVLIGG